MPAKKGGGKKKSPRAKKDTGNFALWINGPDATLWKELCELKRNMDYTTETTPCLYQENW